jgi:rhodanese-related sulfurtransferase
VATRQFDESTPVVHFDPGVEVSPFALFRRLEEGRAPLLVDLRPDGGRLTFVGALSYPRPGWTPPEGREVVVFDDDGTAAVSEARRLQAAGFSRVKALFGGVDLYELALDPQVVGPETHLRERR